MLHSATVMPVIPRPETPEDRLARMSGPAPLAEGARDSKGKALCALCHRRIQRGQREALLKGNRPAHVSCIAMEGGTP